MAYNPKVSVVDYMNSQKMNSSFGSRAKLAQQYGIKGYQGTAQQNGQLLGYLQKPKTTAKPKAPVTKPVVIAPKKPVISSKEKAFYDQYTKAIMGGSNNTAQLGQYNNIVKKYGLKAGSVGGTTLQQLSLKALQGDKNAAAYLKAMNLKGSTGSALWGGFKGDISKESAAVRHQYMKDNPYAQYTKDYDMQHYKTYNDMITNNKQMTNSQIEWYSNMIKKWNLEDMNDPFNQQKAQLEKDKQGALSAQDVALNQGLGAQDATNFQMFNQLQQQMADRGMGGSGIAADAYMRAQMGANQNYQQAFSDSATNKSDIQAQYTDAIYGVKKDKTEFEAGQQQLAAENALAAEKNKIDYLKQQTENDKYLTASTGYVYYNGKQLTYQGKPITSVEYKKLTETQRHNMATENNSAIKNAQDYQLGIDKNAIARQKIAADLQQSIAKNKLEYAKLDFNYSKLESTNAYNQEKIRIAAENAQSTKDKTQLTSLGKQSSDLAKQIVAYQKAGKKPPKDIVDKYNNINNQISSLVGGSGFNSTGGGGGGTLGSLSKKYESGSAGAGTIGNNAGDWGGKSYGTYQIATNTGTMNSFMKFLKNANPRMYNGLGRYSIGSSGFDQAWKQLASADPEFADLQHRFIKQSHYDPVVQNLRGYGVNINDRSSALQNVIWSIGVQHGSGGATNIWKAAGIKSNMSDKEIITRLYNERMKVDKYFSRSSASIKASVKRRFQNELQDALNMLG